LDLHKGTIWQKKKETEMDKEGKVWSHLSPRFGRVRQGVIGGEESTGEKGLGLDVLDIRVGDFSVGKK